MLSTDKAGRIKRLHEAGKSYRQIAKDTGHSTATVHRVLSGNWHHTTVERAPMVQKCPQCGWKFIGHCRPCEARQYIAKRRATA